MVILKNSSKTPDYNGAALDFFKERIWRPIMPSLTSTDVFGACMSALFLTDLSQGRSASAEDGSPVLAFLPGLPFFYRLRGNIDEKIAPVKRPKSVETVAIEGMKAR